MKAFVEVKDLGKAYQGRAAVENLSFTIPPGHIFGLLGPNGAGKTTTISIISGLFPPDKGDVIVDGHSLLTHPARAKALMGVVPQEIALYTTLSARENLHFWGRLYGLKGDALKVRVEQVLERVGLSDRANEAIKGYSGGMKRRINIAAGLLHEPRLLLLDEPTVGVDPQSRRAILDMIKDLNASGMTVLYTSHYMEEVQELCSLVAIMDQGRIVAHGTQEELHRVVGEHDLVRLEVDPPLEDPSFLQSILGVFAVNITPEGVDLTVSDGHTLLATIIAAITQQGAAVNAVRIERPNLETVFLHLTGRMLRN